VPGSFFENVYLPESFVVAETIFHEVSLRLTWIFGSAAQSSPVIVPEIR
jgi:hypothetical protein